MGHVVDVGVVFLNRDGESFGTSPNRFEWPESADHPPSNRVFTAPFKLLVRRLNRLPRRNATITEQCGLFKPPDVVATAVPGRATLLERPHVIR
jgi:hypothetical protein